MIARLNDRAAELALSAQGARDPEDIGEAVPMDHDLCNALTDRWIEAADADPLAWFTPVIFTGRVA